MQTPRKAFSNSRQGIFWGSMTHLINATSRRLNTHTIKQPCPQVLFSVITHNIEMSGCSWVLFWSQRTRPETKPSCSLGNSLNRHSQNAVRTKPNQFWLPLLLTNMQSHPSRPWPLKCHIPFCFIQGGCKKTPKSSPQIFPDL